MPYNPGITPRGELMGLGLGAGLSSMAQSYGRGLELKEEQKRYDDVMKQRRRDRKQLKRSFGMQAELLGMDPQDIDTMGLGELRGFVEGTKLKTSLDYQGLQLQKLQNNIEQTASGKRALGQMQMYVEEQNLSPVDAATSAARDEGLELGEAAKLLNLATTGEKLGLELRTILARERGLDLQAQGQGISQGTLGVQQGQLNLAKEELERQKNPPQPKARDVEGAPGYKVIDMGGGRSQLVQPEDTEDDINSLSVEGRKVTTKVDEILGHIENIEEGDDRYGLANVFSRQSESMDLVKEIAKNNRTYKARFGSNHPDYIRLMRRVAPFIRDNKDSSDETNKKLARKLAAELGISLQSD